MLKRILSLIIAVLIFSVPVAAEGPAVTAPEEEYFNDMGSTERYTEGLGITAEQYEQLKDTVYTATRNCEAGCSISSFGIPYTSSALTLLYMMVKKGDPETFHVDEMSSEYVRSGSNWIFSRLNFTYLYTPEEYQQMRAEMIAAADDMLEGVEGNDALSDVKKALVLHDRLAVHCEYDTESYYSGVPAEHTHDMYGAMIERKCVCEGYTKAYSYLLDRIGLENYYCESYEIGHIWNIVYIDGEKYHVDVTQDDPTPDVTGYVRHRYFLCSSDKMLADPNHNASDYDTTPVSTLYDSAFWTDVYTSFALLGNDLYYVEKSTGDFKKWTGDNKTTLKTINERWRAAQGGYYYGCFSCIASDGTYVYYSLPKSVVRYDAKTGMTSALYEYDPPADMRSFCIYGIKTEDMILTVDVYTSPNFTDTTKADYEFTVPYSHPTKSGDVNGDGVVNMQDLHLFKKYVAGADISSLTFLVANADYNGDGVINVQDVKVMKKYLAG